MVGLRPVNDVRRVGGQCALHTIALIACSVKSTCRRERAVEPFTGLNALAAVGGGVAVDKKLLAGSYSNGASSS